MHQTIAHRAAMRRLILAAVLVIPAGAVSATEFCVVTTTADGFSALRASPSFEGRLLARMRPGEEVRHTGKRSGKWVYVYWWKRESRIERGVENPHAKGWVHDRLIEDCG